jgi:hypothetical protein
MSIAMSKISEFMTVFDINVTQRMPLVGQKLLIFPEYLSSAPCISVVRVARALVVCVMFCRSLFVLFSFGHCVVCPSS